MFLSAPPIIHPHRTKRFLEQLHLISSSNNNISPFVIVILTQASRDAFGTLDDFQLQQ
jgi:hypothetical protein